MKHDCWSCRYMERIPGSEHIRCNHPLFTDIVPEFQVAVPIAILSGKVSQAVHALASAGVEIDAQAIRMGYATFPLDFDPIWVRNCVHYTPQSR